MNGTRLALGLCALALGASAHAAGKFAPDWRRVATSADRERIREWRTAFVQGLDAARAAGHAAEIAREGALLDPDAGLADGRLPPGDYRCRVIKLGSKTGATGAFVASPPFTCHIAAEGDLASFTKTSGAQRPVGMIFSGDGQRDIFLGTMMLGDEQRALDYGRDDDRDMAGAVERIGPERWRLILPYPRFESVMDVIELVPLSRHVADATQ